MRVRDKKGREILDWRAWTRPKEEYQWRATRSAMELARAWFTAPEPVVPPEVRTLLDSHPLTVGSVLVEGWPEFVTSLPFPGEGRNHDLLAVGTVRGERLLLSVEGKVDEPLGEPIGRYWQKSKRTPKSKAWKRIDSLLNSAFGPSAVATEKPWSDLRYQLLTALAGTAIEAAKRDCSLAVLCIHEFLTESANPKKLERNDESFTAFVRALGSRTPKLGVLAGPFVVRVGEPQSEVSVLVGRVQYRWVTR